jgi:Flp pilus assembly protein TadD
VAGLLFETAVEGARPDAAVFPRQHLGVEPHRFERLLARTVADARIDPAHPIASVVATRRPVAWEIGAVSPPAPYHLRAGAPLARLDRDPVAGHRDIRSALASLERIFGRGGGEDAAAAREHANALTSLGRLAIARGDGGLAAALFEAAVKVRPAHVPALVNLGVVAARRGDFRQAAAVTDRAAALDPVHDGALVNAARYHLQLDEDAAARRRIDRALAIAPGRADAWALAGILAARAGELERAAELTRRALALDPREPDAMTTMRKLLRAGVAPGGAAAPGE